MLAPADTGRPPAAGVGETRLAAPMPGRIIRYLKNVGDKAAKGEVVMAFEAMKMGNAVALPCLLRRERPARVTQQRASSFRSAATD
jgi:biotin carboxyl carrier protein